MRNREKKNTKAAIENALQPQEKKREKSKTGARSNGKRNIQTKQKQYAKRKGQKFNNITEIVKEERINLEKEKAIIK
jgi:hypothetical protein